MQLLDKEAVRAANRLEIVIPSLTGEPLSWTGQREPRVRCSFHDDHDPSLRINIDKQLWRCDPCDIGGDVFEFVRLLLHLSFPESLHFLADRAGLSNGNGDVTSSRRTPRTPEREHIYVDEHHTSLFKVVIWGRDADGKKKVTLQRPDEHGGWTNGIDGVRRVIYRLSDLQDKEAVVVAEGEKDADRLWAIGIPATCNMVGAGNWTDSDTLQLKAAGVRRVRVIGDQDAAGRKHNLVVARSCAAHQIDARPVLLPDMPEKGDVSDFLDAHGATGKAALEALLRTAAPWTEPESAILADEDADDAPLARLIDTTWPVALSRAAYVGIFGDIVDTLAPQTEADPVALFLLLLAMFGNVIGRTAHFTVEADTHYLNLFVTLVGKTSKGRKGVSEGRARRFFDPIDPAWTVDCRASGLSTGEGLIWAIRDPIEKEQPVREHNRIVGYETVIEDHGVADKRLMVTEPEFASTLKVMSREGNTLSPTLRKAWDGQSLRTLTKASPLKATDPHVTIMASISEGEVRRLLNATESANGFGNRFLWTCVRRSKLLPDGGTAVPVAALVERLQTLVTEARQVGEMTFDAEAHRLWHEVYPRLSAERPGLLGSLTARAEPQVRRMACLYALGDASPVVQARHLLAALEVWRYCFDSAAYIFGDALGNPQADKLLAALKAAGSTGLTRLEITSRVFQKHLSADDLARAVTMLRDAGLATSRQEGSRGGRRAERWFYTPEACEQSEQSKRSAVTKSDQGTLSALFAGSQPESSNSHRLDGLEPGAPDEVFEL